MEQRFSQKAHRLCLWAGPALFVLYIVGFVPMARLLPPPSPDWPAERLVHWLVGHQVGFQAGCVLMVMGGALFGPWGAVPAIFTRKAEARFPVLYATQIISLGCAVCLSVLVALFWAVASFRAGEISPEITQALWDVGWFLFLFDAPPFLVWLAALALGILWNPPEHQLYPRWIAYMTLGVLLEMTSAMAMVFFKFGPWTYTGLLAMWLTFSLFFGWLCVMTAFGFKAVARQEALSRQEEAAAPGSYAARPDTASSDARAAALPAPGSLGMPLAQPNGASLGGGPQEHTGSS
ncbi:hypothetical protein [Streptomyces sp. NPDC059874]|uniref:hypothetical protein n=1 Tax=Streptomyces sp. NPDC059874 TaxID=3346983 RepID=UPI003650C465